MGNTGSGIKGLNKSQQQTQAPQVNKLATKPQLISKNSSSRR